MNLNQLVPDSVTPEVGDAEVFETEEAAALCSGGDLELNRSLDQCGDLDLSPERSLGDADSGVAQKIIAVAGEDGVILDGQDHVKIARRPALGSGLAFPAQA